MKFGWNMRAREITLTIGLLICAALTSQPALAGLNTATLKGQITDGTAAAQAGVEIVATNTDNGFAYRTITKADGSYVLTGVAPGTYQIGVAGAAKKSEVITLAVGETASLNFSVTAIDKATMLSEVIVSGSILRKDVKSSEVGTNVSRNQIENLPQATRNILAFADLAPGVRFTVDQGSGNVRLQSGSQNQDNVNIFIDGVGQKNYVLRGGIAGMDSTRGNPFPQSAISEYRIITQNYKAEYDQVSSAAITAVTRSGTNTLHGSVFFDRVDDSWVAMSPFQKRAEAAGVPRPPFHQNQYGFSLGGPIVQDRAHYFIAYEGKDIIQARQVVLQNANLLPNTGIVPSLLALQGSSSDEFKENLVLGKISAQLTDDQRLEFTARIRRESDFVPEDRVLSAPGNSKDRTNDETRFDLRHELRRGDWLNVARVGYQDTLWNPHSRSSDPMIQYFVSTSTPQSSTSVVPVLFVGGSPDAQKRGQSGYLLQNDLTFTGRAGHTMKAGVKLNILTFDLSGTALSVPILKQRIDRVTGLVTETFDTRNALAPVGVSIRDNQIGLYFQDDWEVNDRLELNLGVRWDYETNMLNNDYVTPADRVTALYALDGPRWGLTPPPGQTYAQSLALGGIDIDRYIADGNSRKAYTGAIQPRIGFSYDFSGGDRSTVLFGGAGRAYDRTMANHSLDELQKNRQPGGEIWLIKKNHKMPYTDQFSLGVRQGLGQWIGELGYTNSYSHNQFNWYGGNRDALGGWATQSPIDPLWGGPVGFGTLILGDFITKARTESVYLKAEKDYTRESGWGATAAYTYSTGETTNRQWTNDIFNWTYGKPGQYGFNPSVDVERHRLVATAYTTKMPFGMLLSAKATLGSGLPFQVTSCAAGWSACIFHKGEGESHSQIDLGLAKEFDVGFSRMMIRADVLNLLNEVNYGGYEGWGGGPGNPQNVYGGDNPNTGVPNSIYGPMRTLKLSFSAAF